MESIVAMDHSRLDCSAAARRIMASTDCRLTVNPRLRKHLQEDEASVNEDSERSIEPEIRFVDYFASIHVQLKDANLVMPEGFHSSDPRYAPVA